MQGRLCCNATEACRCNAVNGNPTLLDLGGIPSILEVNANASLELRDLLIKNVAPTPALRNATRNALARLTYVSGMLRWDEHPPGVCMLVFCFRRSAPCVHLPPSMCRPTMLSRLPGSACGCTLASARLHAQSLCLRTGAMATPCGRACQDTSIAFACFLVRATRQPLVHGCARHRV